MACSGTKLTLFLDRRRRFVRRFMRERAGVVTERLFLHSHRAGVVTERLFLHSHSTGVVTERLFLHSHRSTEVVFFWSKYTC
jgi:hypothetical protein